MVHDNCKDCVSKCEHAGKDRDFVCMNGKSCKVIKSTRTNADKIRDMSDEDIEKWVYAHCSECEICPAYDFCKNLEMTSCKKIISDWLKQPAEK